MSSTFIRLGQGGSVSFKDGVATVGNLPAVGNNIGDIRGVLSPPSIWMWNGSTWVDTDTGGGGSGTVTSVDMTVPSFLNVSGNPITTSGTLAVTLVPEAQNSVFAGPTSGSGVPTFRALTSADIPSPNFPLLAPNGTVSSPSYSFSTSTNTGMYLASIGNLALAVAGSAIINISASGTVLNSGLTVQSVTVTTNYSIT